MKYTYVIEARGCEWGCAIGAAATRKAAKAYIADCRAWLAKAPPIADNENADMDEWDRQYERRKRYITRRKCGAAIEGADDLLVVRVPLWG